MNGSQLVWAPVSHGGITAIMTPSPDNEGMTWVTLAGPRASSTQIKTLNPSSLSRPSLPQTFELVGRDSDGSAVVKYGFELRQWFVNRGNERDWNSDQAEWCSRLGYRMARISDLTNAVCIEAPWCQGAIGATPSSDGNHYQRRIGAGLFTEWGYMTHYIDTDFADYSYSVSDAADRVQFDVYSDDGRIRSSGTFYSSSHYCLCTMP
ncbi:hypothetical protein [Gilliamella sp. Pas-s25]|uniref:hypothetical protein n=1 Tax=Gilliamella sp. Pas-s25 TaxID=2687310 RepID=UPI00135DE9D7|nr:hypothetical protein [Gilliamella sp. Pas-s25]MWP62633.1 hypothetical protein [Gilliamella sp. Pas-s25]